MCLFCKIINGEIPSKKVYEDKNVIGILDISQATKGHTILLPKKHYDNILDADEACLLSLAHAINKFAPVLVEKLHAKGINVVNNSGEVANQSVMHLHVHLIPRYDLNEYGYKAQDNTGKFDLDAIQKEILE